MMRNSFKKDFGAKVEDDPEGKPVLAPDGKHYIKQNGKWHMVVQ